MRKIFIVMGIIVTAVLLGYLLLSSFYPSQTVDFSTEVKPILNKHCIACHGGVKQNAGFSVLFREEALGETESGRPAIIPGDPGSSEFIRRITSNDPEERMPYDHPPLGKEEVRILKRWVREGAEWGEHWAYTPLEEVEVPAGGDEKHTVNEIDRFVLERLEEEDGLQPSPEAEKTDLLRRVSFDLTGLPPAPEMLERFLNDKSPDAYEKVVDSLLASPGYGERWTAMWLDLARYADTKGYEKDLGRKIWRYRDWVIRAFNADMPFDEFTIKQLAGDLLPDPSEDDLIATAFHRNTMANDEAGTYHEEFRIAAVIDRVNTTWQVWQGTTFECVQCHSHPYDPFRHEDYYKSMAFFNNARDEDTFGDHPKLRIYEGDNREELHDILAWIKEYGTEEEVKETRRFLTTTEPKIHAHDCDSFKNGELLGTVFLGIRDGGHCRLKEISLDGKTHLMMNLLAFYGVGHKGGEMEIRLDSVNGPLLTQYTVAPVRKDRVERVPLKPGTRGRHDLYLIFRNPSLPPDQAVCAIEWFAFREELPGKGEPGYEHKMQEVTGLLNAKAETVPVTIENPEEMRRPTHVFERGNWLTPGKEVTPDVPASLNPFPENAPRNRLGFARWLISPDNPLTARTMVNRFWEQLFGTGLVETVEDFGSQGFTPSHPALLDWLAWQFMHEYKWSMKKLLKTMVISATYRQSSKVTPEVLETDPDNRLLARGARFRLTAEQVRDQALAVSGLLSEKMYGPSVMPYQPPGVWKSVYNAESWETSEGEDRYRRAVYTYIKRTSPYPSLITFDGSSREVCLSRRIRTNTPLQALVTLNDPAFMEAARHLADKMDAAGRQHNIKTCIEAGYKQATLKNISPENLSVLQQLYEQALQEYRKEPEAAEKLLQGETGGDGSLSEPVARSRPEASPAVNRSGGEGLSGPAIRADRTVRGSGQHGSSQKAHTAALIVVANAIMNLDEFLMKN